MMERMPVMIVIKRVLVVIVMVRMPVMIVISDDCDG